MGGGGGGDGQFYDVALRRRQALMGSSGPMGLVQNFKVFRIALFACIGGVLYGYNQGYVDYAPSLVLLLYPNFLPSGVSVVDTGGKRE